MRFRKLVYFVHLWSGLIFGVWFAFVGLTGAVLAWNPVLIPKELEMRVGVGAQSTEAMVPPSVSLATVQALHPEIPRGQLTRFIAPSSIYPYYIWIVPNKSNAFDPKFAVVDPRNGKLLAEVYRPQTAMGWIQAAHANLLRGPLGLIATCALTFFALGAVLSGLWLWWPKTVGQFRNRIRAKLKSPPHRLARDLHNVFGFYALTPMLLLAFTGFLMSLNSITKSSIENSINKIAHAKEEQPVKATVGKPLALDELYERSKQYVGDGNILFVSLPKKAGTPLTVTFERPGLGLLRSGAVVIDPTNGKLIENTLKSEESPGHLARAVWTELHLGQYGGSLSRILYTIAGLIPTCLWVTGLLMWIHRKKKLAI